jgi:hypothetical protein
VGAKLVKDIYPLLRSDESFITPQRQTPAEEIPWLTIRRIQGPVANPVSGAIANEDRDTADMITKRSQTGCYRVSM